MNDLFPQTIQDLDAAVRDLGGKAYLVGGGVLNLLRFQEVKDWDIEVFGLSYQDLEMIANQFGEADLIGQKFGVVKLKANDLDIELAVPRIENNVGPGHKDFDVTLIPDLRLEEAALRRDLTMNAIYLEIGNQKIHDPYNGLVDFQRGIIQHINPETFVEDPLRAFRVMQLVSRKGKFITQETVELCRAMKDACAELSGDAIYGEFYKMLMLSDRPDRGLRFLRNSGLLRLFPELLALVGCPQKEKYHPEGDVWTHTQMVLREAAIYRDDLPEEWRLPFMFGMLLHDVGKPITLDPEKLTTYDHDSKGKRIARKFMKRLTKNEDLIKKVESIVGVHMRPRMFLKSHAKAPAWRRLHNKCPLHILAYVAMCDRDGRGIDPSIREGRGSLVFEECMRMHVIIGSHPENIPPVLMGRHLIEAGYKPGTEFGAMLNKAYEYQLETGCSDIQELINAATNQTKESN